MRPRRTRTAAPRDPLLAREAPRPRDAVRGLRPGERRRGTCPVPAVPEAAQRVVEGSAGPLHCNPARVRGRPAPSGRRLLCARLSSLLFSSLRSLNQKRRAGGAEASGGGDGACATVGRNPGAAARKGRWKATGGGGGGGGLHAGPARGWAQSPRPAPDRPRPAPREKPPRPAGEGSGPQNGEGAGQAESDVAEAGGAVRPLGKRAAESRSAPRFARSSKLRRERPSGKTQNPRQGPRRRDRVAWD